MKANSAINLAIVIAIVAAAVFMPLLSNSADAATLEGPLYRDLQQPPPPPGPPPSTGKPGNTAGGAPSADQPGANAPAPPAPAFAPSPSEQLPDPNVAASGRSAELSVDAMAVAIGELEVVVDRGCGSTYKLGDRIEFVGRRGNSTSAGYWLYMEIWNSTNQAWWSKLAADWVAPGGSISMSGRIAEPTGQEQLYARLIDEFGNVVQDTWCDYQSSASPQFDQLQCNQTAVRVLQINEAHKWSFYGNGGQTIRISMQGPGGLDTYLELRAPDGSLIASNDDINAPWDLNSRMQVRLPSTGFYTIVARGFKYQAGEYALSVFCQ